MKMKTITIDGIEYQLTPVPTEAPKPVQWEPKRVGINAYYYAIDKEGIIFTAMDRRDGFERQRASFGNYFHIESEAEEASKQVRQLLRLCAYVREFAPDYKPDWGNYNEQKWYIFFNKEDKKWSYNNNQFNCTVATVYMPKNVAEELVKKLNSGEVVL